MVQTRKNCDAASLLFIFILKKRAPNYVSSRVRSNLVKNNPADFVCPGCQARYKLVRVRSEARSRGFPLHCKVCKQPLAAKDGEDVLKYFLISRQRVKRQGGA
jgi:hypothetical protein